MAKLYPSGKKKIDTSEYDRLTYGTENEDKTQTQPYKLASATREDPEDPSTMEAPAATRPGLLQGHEMFGKLGGPKAIREEEPQGMFDNMKAASVSPDAIKGMAGPKGFMPGESGGLPEMKSSPELPEGGAKKPGLFGKLFGYSDPQKLDELGLTIPQARHEGILSKIGRYAIPAAFGLFGGAGILPGIMAGMGAGRRGEAAEQEAQTKYLQERAKLLKGPASVEEFQYISKLPPEQKAQYMDYLKSKNPTSGLGLDRFLYQQQRDAAEDARRAQESKEKMGAKQEEQLDKAIERLSAKLGNSQDAVTSLQEVKDLIGFDPEDYDPKTKTVGGKEIDLPGVSVPGLGRISAYSGDAKDLANAASKIFNITLKDRSGAAITSTELDRLRDEFSQGKFNDEDELIKGMARYQRALRAAMSNVEAGFKPEAVDTLRERGGITSKRLERKQAANKPANANGKMRLPDGTIHWVDKDDNDLGVVQ